MWKKAALPSIISLLLLPLLLLLIVWTPGCTKSDYEVYMGAAERTGSVARGKAELQMAIKQEFNKKGLSQEVAEGLAVFEEMAFEVKSEFDRGKGESLHKIFVKTKDAGFDAKVYTKGGVAYVITPLIPKILVIRGAELIHTDWAAGNRERMLVPSRESLVAIKKVWESLYSDDNISALEKIVLDTPEGSVKARRYVANIADAQLKPALKKTMELVMQDSAFMEEINEMMSSAMKTYLDKANTAGGRAGGEEFEFSLENFSLAEAMRANMEAIENATVTTFSQTAFLDRDNYIIEERVNLDVRFHFTGAGAPRSYSMELTKKNWDLNRAQEIYFPEVTAANSITLAELEDEYPGGLNDFFGGEAD